jgi:hypothetical protein
VSPIISASISREIGKFFTENFFTEIKYKVINIKKNPKIIPLNELLIG